MGRRSRAATANAENLKKRKVRLVYEEAQSPALIAVDADTDAPIAIINDYQYRIEELKSRLSRTFEEVTQSASSLDSHSVNLPDPIPPPPPVLPVAVTPACTTRKDGSQQNPETHFVPAPSQQEAEKALADLLAILHPRRKDGKRTKAVHFEGDEFLRCRLERMEAFLRLYIGDPALGWKNASIQASRAFGWGLTAAQSLRAWTRTFMEDCEDLPFNPYGTWVTSLLRKGDLATKLGLHLQSVGKYVRAQDVVEFIARPDIQEEYGLTKGISFSTATGWMHTMGYRWRREPSGQFVDGHERADVVEYRQKKFLPAMLKHKDRLRVFLDGTYSAPETPTPDRCVIFWFHDESTFYANDRRTIRWVHESETAVPKPKGEGQSIMVADFVSADYGWMRSKDGAQSARIVFRAGKGRDGYFSNDEILDHLRTAIDIAQSSYPEDDHVFILDNATPHVKRADDALSARHMTKNPTALGKGLWGVFSNVYENGKHVYDRDGKYLKEKKCMGDAKFADGSPQSLYFPDHHPTHPGAFKGMTVLLQERGFANAASLRAECPNFKCPPNTEQCCQRRLLYNQPDFANVESVAETYCKSRGVELIFLPKFHCELNPIERCWCHAKRQYRQYPLSKTDAELEANMLKALDSVPKLSMERYFDGVLRLMDGYFTYNLTGAQALWAKKKYKSHRVIPADKLLIDMKKAGLLPNTV